MQLETLQSRIDPLVKNKELQALIVSQQEISWKN